MRPIIFHSFSRPLPYVQVLALQQQIHELQLQQRRASPGSHQDVLLLLEHRPVYTAGRRQSDDEVRRESTRLRLLGADFVATKRGGQTTYHGPGQVVGYPLFDLARMRLSIAGYICKIQTLLKQHFLENHRTPTVDSDNTGVFLTSNVKLASIGVQVRHRLTSHGFAYNVTREPLAWFDQIIACGLAEVNAGCVVDATGHDVPMQEDVKSLVTTASRVFDREMIKLDTMKEGPLEHAVRKLERSAELLEPWLHIPAVSK
ncbi:lipoyltransferase [Ramaria rubella]|nr:lipoyltransferase [Ramaria rubella]